MRISELSRRTSVPVPTIKYYLRAGILSGGRLIGATQAVYDEGHVQRLLLIRALADVGELSLASIREILRAVDDEGTSVHEMLGTAQYALGEAADGQDDPEWEATRVEVDEFLGDLGWQVTAGAPARLRLVRALLTLRRLGFSRSARDLHPYAEAAHAIATQEVAWLPDRGPRAEAVERAVVMTVLGEPVLLALRRLAQEHESARRFGDDTADPTSGPPST